MALQVPNRYIPMLNLVRNLSQPAATELLHALESAQVIASPDDMASNIAESVPSIPREDLGKIVDLLYSLYHVRELSELNRNSFLKELVESVRENANPNISDEELPAIRQRFKDLLDLKTLASISKAIGLQRDEERVYCEAKIISDIRPVFGEDIKVKPVAATITHSLKISYHENGDHKEFYIVLDEVDLDQLEKMIKRAKTKADTLTQVLSDSQIPRLGI
jgi:hypothetical protein